VRFFGKSRYQEVDQALLQLQKGGFTIRENDYFSLAGSQHVIFENCTDDDHMQFVKSSIADAGKKIDSYFGENKSTLFQSMILSVNCKNLPEFIAKLRQESIRWQTEIESPDADTLVRYNMQIYPVTETSEL